MRYVVSILEKVLPFLRSPGKEKNSMAVSKAQQKAVTKYDAKAYDKTLLRLPKGRLNIIKTHASTRGESVNGFIGRAILETMERDAGGAAAPGVAPVERVLAETAPTSSQQFEETARRGARAPVSSDTLEAAQRAAEASGEAVPVFVTRAVSETAERDRLSRDS